MNRPYGSQDGFTLIEAVCAMAIIGLVAAVLLPNIPQQTSRPRLEAYAIQIATLLKTDRNAAIGNRQVVATLIDAPSRTLRSGATGEVLRVPDDVRLDSVLPRSCNDHTVGAEIDFFPSGMSCGGMIVLSRRDTGFEVQVNWLTGKVDVGVQSHAAP
ncbi:MAG: prepilin-type N-terminal cleavage/methylation domain-containing protein [Xanthobacteraceae bacterium]|nr:prepilin-type N-terminal cleavage/methylation domain-containing protein [Xanthobacteraceae bacterium]